MIIPIIVLTCETETELGDFEQDSGVKYLENLLKTESVTFEGIAIVEYYNCTDETGEVLVVFSPTVSTVDDFQTISGIGMNPFVIYTTINGRLNYYDCSIRDHPDEKYGYPAEGFYDRGMKTFTFYDCSVTNNKTTGSGSFGDGSESPYPNEGNYHTFSGEYSCYQLDSNGERLMYKVRFDTVRKIN